MIEDKLGIIIPTYNRDKYLEQTLSKLFKSPFVNCPITIFDNNSLDNTPKICEKYEKLFPNLTVIRRPANIGGNANIIRAFETATTEYNWVLGDNDKLDFSECEDVISAIESEKFDIILTCSPGINSSRIKSIQEELMQKNLKNPDNFLETNGQDLLNILDIDYFITFSFMSSFIYKSKLFDSKCLMKGYDNIPNQYPHYPFIIKVFEDNLSIYKSKNDLIIIQLNPDDSEKTTFYWVISWLNSSLLIQDKKIRKIASRFPEGPTLPVVLAHIIFTKALNENSINNYDIISLKCVIRKLYGCIKGNFFNIIISIVKNIPRNICKIIYKYYKNNQKKILNDFN